VAHGNSRTPKTAAAFLTERYQDVLSQCIYEKSSVAEFAELLNVSPNHLHKSVKSVTGKTAHDMLADMRILEAKVLLKQSNLSIGEIAYKVGKSDQSDFAKFFKSRTSMTPNQYRQNIA
jgi:AraC family transcriptional regulator, transcriptional activator of pobA